MATGITADWNFVVVVVLETVFIKFVDSWKKINVLSKLSLSPKLILEPVPSCPRIVIFLLTMEVPSPLPGRCGHWWTLMTNLTPIFVTALFCLATGPAEPDTDPPTHFGAWSGTSLLAVDLCCGHGAASEPGYPHWAWCWPAGWLHNQFGLGLVTRTCAMSSCLNLVAVSSRPQGVWDRFWVMRPLLYLLGLCFWLLIP